MSKGHSRTTAAAVLILLAWGVLAFASVYRWASIPLGLGCAAFGVWAIVRRRHDMVNGAMRVFAVALAILCGAVSVQLVPLSIDVIRDVTPATDAFLREYSLAYPSLDRHPISLQPSDTAFGLALLTSFALFTYGLARALTASTVEAIALGLAVLGSMVAFEGAIQRTVSTETIYGFWRPEAPGVVTFGPFVNRNHFAGWMLMALSLTIGYLFAAIERNPVAQMSGWRRRIIWLGSPSASPVLAIGCAVIVMTLVLMLTLSRSGMACFGIALVVWVLATARRSASVWVRAAAVAYLVLIAGLGATWVGSSTLAARFDDLGVNDANRLLAWADALEVLKAFALTGTGLNAYDAALLRYDSGTTGKFFGQVHNDYLQLAAEGGLLVTVPAIFAIVAFATAVHRRFKNDDAAGRWLRLGAVTGLFSVALQEAVDFSLQIPGNAVLFAALAGIALHRSVSHAVTPSVSTVESPDRPRGSGPVPTPLPRRGLETKLMAITDRAAVTLGALQSESGRVER